MTYLINTITSWNEPPRARHQVAQTLAKDHKVIFVARNEVGFPKLSRDVISQNLTVITPFSPVDYRIRYRLPVINEIYQEWLFRQLSSSFEQPRVINFDPTATRIFNYFKDVIYYCNDDHTEISKNINNKFIYKYHLNAVKKVAGKAKFCVVTTDFLAQKFSKINGRVFEIRLGGPNLADYKISLNRHVRHNRYINIGFVGFIEPFNISKDIIAALANLPNCTLTLVGPEKNDCLKEYRSRENVYFKGTLKGEDLYQEINKFDVAIVPYDLNNEFDRSPNKMWQYLALGKPVVMSNISAVEKWIFPEGIIYKASTVEEFVACILKAFKEDNEHLINQRIEISTANTWDNRIADLLSLYEKYK